MRFSCFLLAFLFTCAIAAQSPDTSIQPGDVGQIELSNAHYPLRPIRVYYPQAAAGPAPTVFFAHGFTAEYPRAYEKLFHHLAANGYAVVNVPYSSLTLRHATRYTTLREGFRQAARQLPGVIDTSRVVFAGHSFGGGAIFSLAFHAFTDWNWGQNGRLLFSMAPWYALEITTAELASFPTNTHLVMQVYEDDLINDHRIAADLFQTCNIDADRKIFYGVEIPGKQIFQLARHTLPSSRVSNTKDELAVFLPLVNWCRYTFNGTPVQTVKGNDALQIEATVQPIPARKSWTFVFPFNRKRNPRFGQEIS